jgi:hypothetical protein
MAFLSFNLNLFLMKILLSMLLLGVVLNAAAQKTQRDSIETTARSTPGRTLFVNAGLQYMSDLTYAGRKDASSVPLLLPSATLISKQGLFLSAIGYFDLNGSASGTEGLSVTPGYVFSFDAQKHFGGAVSATKYFITSKSPIILSSFNATIDGQLYYNPGFAKVTLAGSYRFDKNNASDVINDVELTKDIQLVKLNAKSNEGFKIAPDVVLYAGTQSFYQTYYTTSQVQRAVQNPSSANPINLLFPKQSSQTIVTQTVTQQKQQEVKQYKLLALSGSLPLTYTIKTLQLSFTPYLIKPFNQVNYTNNTAMNGTYFLFTVGGNITF